MIIKTVNGDVLSAPEMYIAHQCNCMTVRSHGLAASIARTFPEADVYGQRGRDGTRNRTTHPDTPGTISVLPSGEISIICMFAQWAPGKPFTFSRYYPFTYHDSHDTRLRWFKECLDKIDALNLEAVAIPYNIGCGLAGGKWLDYEQYIKNANTPFVVYKFN